MEKRKREIKELERKNMETIQEVYKGLKEDEEVKKWKEKIKLQMDQGDRG